jgi:regulator of replication initiation timing
MTNEDRLLLNELRNNINRLFQQYIEVETSKKLLAEEITALKQEISRLKNEKEALCRKNENLKIANLMLSGSDENKMAKKRLNTIVREIDKCIALLNR